MRIALFTDTFLPQINGVTHTIGRMLQWFDEQGIDCIVFAPQYGSKDPVQAEVERYPSLYFIPYPDCRLAMPGASRIDAKLTRFQPDLILDMTEFNMGQAGLAAARRLGLPAVSNYSTHFPQYLSYYRAEWLEPWAWRYIRQFHNRHRLVLCPSTDAQKCLGANGVENTGIFSRGIDMKRFHPAKRSEAWREAMDIGSRVAVMYAGRLSAEKDLDILLDAWHVMTELYGDSIRLIMAGDGPLAARCRRDFPANTRFTGFLRGEELSVAYASCDLFAFPSSTETFGNVVLEAMASGLPVIGAAAGGVGDIIRHGHNGIAFPARNARLLAVSLSGLIANAELRGHYAANGLASAAERTWDSEFRRLMGHLERVAGSEAAHLKPDSLLHVS